MLGALVTFARSKMLVSMNIGELLSVVAIHLLTAEGQPFQLCAEIITRKISQIDFDVSFTCSEFQPRLELDYGHQMI